MLNIGERAEAIVEAFKQRQMSTREALEQLEKLLKEINQAEKEQAERGLAGTPFAVFWLLTKESVPLAEAEKIAVEIDSVLKHYPYHKTSETQTREIRKRIYPLLEKAGVADVKELAKKIMETIGRR